MAPRQTYTIAGKLFKSKVAVKDTIKALRDAQTLGVPLKAVDHAFVLEVFRVFHPERVTSTVCSMHVEDNTGKYFVFTLENGRQTVPSLLKVFQPSARTSTQEAINALRRIAFFDCCQPYRDAYFKANEDAQGRAPCELTGRLVTREEVEVDHIDPSFEAIRSSFLEEMGMSLSEIPLEESPNGLGKIITEPFLVKEWKAYHRKKARLRVLARDVHVERTREG